MKKLLLSFLPLLLMVLSGFTAQAQDLSVTVTWDVPGAVLLYKGASTESGVPIALPESATSYTITEKDEFVFAPVDGYCFTAADIEGGGSALAANTYGDFTQVCKISTKYTSGVNKFNNKTVDIKVEKLLYDTSFNIDIHNGANKIVATLYNGTIKTRTLELEDGKKNIPLTQFENKLELQAASYPRSAFFAVTLDGEPVEYALTKYSINLTDGCNVYVAYGDPAINQPASKYKITFEFVNNNPECLYSIRDWTASKFLDLGKLQEGYNIEGGSQIKINFKEDYTVNSVTANGMEINYADKYTVEGDTKFTIDVTSLTYTSLSATVYTNEIDGISFENSSMHEDAGEITVTKVADKPAGSVTLSGVVVKEAVGEYTLGNISGKTKNVFFNIKPGYWFKGGVLANPSEPDNYYISAASAFNQVEAPVYMNVGKIDFDTPAEVYYDGPADVVRLRSIAKLMDGSSVTSTYGGATPGEYVNPGMTNIMMDPDYNSSFEISIYEDEAHAGWGKLVLVDGVEQKPNSDDSDKPGVYENVKLTANSKLQIYFTEVTPKIRTLMFLTAGDAKASLTCGGMTITDFSQSITTAASGNYVITPEAGTTIKVNGENVTLTDGKYTFAPTGGSVTRIELVKEGFGELACSTKPVNGATVKSLSSVDLELAMDESFMNGESTPNVVDNAASWISVSNGVKVASFGIGDPSETAIPFTITFDKPITAAGTYTVTVPAGIIYEAFPNADWSAFERTSSSRVNPEVRLNVTVDPDMVYAWTFDPAANSENDLPGEYDDSVIITISLPEAESLSEESFTEGAGPWIKYNGSPVAKVDDLWEEKGWAFTRTYATYGKPALAIEISKDVFNTAGTLSIAADEGAFTVNGALASPAIDYTAQFGQEKNYSYEFTPEENTTITDWQEFTLTFPEATMVEYDEDNSYIVVSQGYSWGTMTVDVTVNGNVVTLKPQSDGKPGSGSLSITIGEGSFILDGANLSPEIAARWTYERTDAVNFTWTPSPAGKLVNQGWGVYATIVYDEIEKVSITNRDAIVVKFDGEPLGALDWDDESIAGADVMSEGGNALMINVANGIFSDPELSGTLSVSIPAGALSISGQPNPEAIEYSWQVVPYKKYTIEVSPASGSKVKEIRDIIVRFPEAETVKLHENFMNGWIFVKKGYAVVAQATGVIAEADGSFKISFDPITDSGDYTITINRACFFIDDAQDSDACDVKLTVDPNMSGIDGVEAADGLYTVYNLQGILVLRDATYEEYKALPAGIYIVNGEKIAKR